MGVFVTNVSFKACQSRVAGRVGHEVHTHDLGTIL